MVLWSVLMFYCNGGWAPWGVVAHSGTNVCHHNIIAIEDCEISLQSFLVSIIEICQVFIRKDLFELDVSIATKLLHGCTILIPILPCFLAIATSMATLHLHPWFVIFVSTGATEKLCGMTMGDAHEHDWVVMVPWQALLHLNVHIKKWDSSEDCYFSLTNGSFQFKMWDPGGCFLVHWKGLVELRASWEDAMVFAFTGAIDKERVG